MSDYAKKQLVICSLPASTKSLTLAFTDCGSINDTSVDYSTSMNNAYYVYVYVVTEVLSN